MPLVIRPAVTTDAPLVMALIRELAEYERLAHEVDATEETVAAALVGPDPRVFCDIAERDGETVGFALWFYSFSTFRGRHGIYLEDLYVRPAARRHGVGRALLAGLARRCVAESLVRLEWSVLDWNELAIGFYRALGAGPRDGWTRFRMDGPALDRIGAAG